MNHPQLKLAALAVLALCGGTSSAQDPTVMIEKHIVMADAGAPGQVRAFAFAGTPEMMRNADWTRFMSTEMGDGGKVVKDAPYSAEAITEATQVLGDGNRITKKTATLLYRDAAGRTRQEQTAPGNSVFINDPVTGRHTVLNVERKTATVMPRLGALGALSPNFPRELQENLQRELKGNLRGELDVEKLKELAKSGELEKLKELSKSGRAHIIHKSSGEGHVVTKSADGETTEIINVPGRQIVIKRREVNKGDGTKSVEENKEVRISVVRAHDGDDSIAIAGLPLDLDGVMAMRAGRQKGVTTSLGVKDVGGVKAEGTQTIATIAAGEIGNEKPIQIISEKWYSPELQTVVYSRHSDPRRGETIYRLNNIRRVAQPADLFAVPPGYTIKEPTVAIAPRPPAPPSAPGSSVAPTPPAPPAAPR
jgi:hypothetical protein